MPTRAQNYHFTWKHITHSSRTLVEVNKGRRDVKLTKTMTPADIAEERAKIMAELDKLGYKLPGVND